MKGDAAFVVATVVFAGATLALGNGVLAPRLQPAVASNTVGLPLTQQKRLEEVATASLFGQFRSSMADFLYLKVDKYLHRGVDMRGLTPEEEKSGHADEVKTTKADLDKGFKQHEGETTVVPSAHNDWRGVIGDMERAVQPYGDMSHHEHADTTEALPLFRLMTWSNPHFIPGYTIGASLMEHKQAKEAVAFLEEGARNNPESIEIQFSLGEMLAYRMRQSDQALPHLQNAITLATHRDATTLTEDELEAYEASYRYVIILLRDANRHAEARAVAEACLKRFPTNNTAHGYLEQQKKTHS